jgi:hypothetical protein
LFYIIRFFLITIAFLSAAIGASAFMIFLLWGALSHGEMGNSEFQNFVHLAAGISTPLLAAFVAYYTFLPAMLVTLVSEYLAKRSWLFHALGGIVVASGIILIIVASGVIFGTIYWLIAGRSAGQISGRIV